MPKTKAKPRQEARSRRSRKRPSPASRPVDLDDDALLDIVQKQTLRYFWDFAHPVSGLARERSNLRPEYGLEVVTTGGSGFGVMAIIVGVARGWIGRAEAVERLQTMVRFLFRADSYHGILPHFLNGDTGKSVPFTRKDDGSDIVETSFLLAGLLCARQYFDREDDNESRLRTWINWLWEEAEWSWHTQGGRNVLYWHWSPNNGWSMNHEIRGWNECLITYVLAASAPRYPIHPDVYHRGFADGRAFRNGREFYRHYLAARAGLRRAAVPGPVLVPRPRSARAHGPLRRLLPAERRAHADQLRALRAQPARVQGLRPRVLGSHLERRLSRLPWALAGSRPRA